MIGEYINVTIKNFICRKDVKNMKKTEYTMDKEYFNSLVERLKDHEDCREIIIDFTGCVVNMMLEDTDFLSIKHNRKLREKIVQFQKDLLEATK